MDKKLQQKLFRKYPYMFKDRKLTGDKTRICDGICCGDGWYELIDNACQQLKFLQIRLSVYVSFFQVKEKFAGLRIYCNKVEYPYGSSDPCYDSKEEKSISEIIRSIIHRAECQSFHTCDVCGGYRDENKKLGSWIYAICDDCWWKFLKKNKIRKNELKK